MRKIFSTLYSYLITVTYDGSEFDGWATQPNQFTVQGYIENALSKIFSSKIGILAASRTDKGVHAYHQHFTLQFGLAFTSSKLLNVLKKTLGKHVLIQKVRKVSSDFHPIRDVIRKEYRYFINTGTYNIFQKKYYWEYNLSLEVKKLNNILQIFQGYHDFFNYSFCRIKDRLKTNTQREIFGIKSWKRKNTIIISIVGKGFLRYQIRALIGEVINCYEGKQTIEDLKKRLTGNKEKVNKYRNLAPPSGLYLWKIDYSFKTQKKHPK